MKSEALSSVCPIFQEDLKGKHPSRANMTKLHIFARYKLRCKMVSLFSQQNKNHTEAYKHRHIRVHL